MSLGNHMHRRLGGVKTFASLMAGYATGSDDAHWPLNETSWTHDTRGAITDVLGSSDGLADAWYDHNQSVSYPPQSVPSIVKGISATATRFHDNGTRAGANDRLVLGRILSPSISESCTFLVWVAMLRPGAGTGTAVRIATNSGGNADPVLHPISTYNWLITNITATPDTVQLDNVGQIAASSMGNIPSLFALTLQGTNPNEVTDFYLFHNDTMYKRQRTDGRNAVSTGTYEGMLLENCRYADSSGGGETYTTFQEAWYLRGQALSQAQLQQLYGAGKP